MSVVDEVIAANREYAGNFGAKGELAPGRAHRPAARSTG